GWCVARRSARSCCGGRIGGMTLRSARAAAKRWKRSAWPLWWEAPRPYSPRGGCGVLVARVHLRHESIQQLALPDHAELLARRPLLRGGIVFERVRQTLQRVELVLELPHGPTLLGELAAELEPVEHAVLPRLKGQSREDHRRSDRDQPAARHNPYKCRPG